DESYAREQPSFNLILVEQLPQPFLNAGRSVFAQEFEHQAVERLHANLKRLVRSPAACRAQCAPCRSPGRTRYKWSGWIGVEPTTSRPHDERSNAELHPEELGN